MKISNFKFQIILVTLLMFGFAGRVSADEIIASSSSQATESAKINYELQQEIR